MLSTAPELVAATSAIAGASLRALTGGARRYVAIAAGSLSIGVGIAWLGAAA